MTRDELVDELAQLDGNEWRKLATKVSWFLRRGGELPERFEPHIELVEDKASWDALRRDVSRVRQQRYRSSQKALTLDQRERRKVYMRNYMRRRRGSD